MVASGAAHLLHLVAAVERGFQQRREHAGLLLGEARPDGSATRQRAHLHRAGIPRRTRPKCRGTGSSRGPLPPWRGVFQSAGAPPAAGSDRAPWPAAARRIDPVLAHAFLSPVNGHFVGHVVTVRIRRRPAGFAQGARSAQGQPPARIQSFAEGRVLRKARPSEYPARGPASRS